MADQDFTHLRGEWLENGCVLLSQVLDAQALGKCRKLFEETAKNPWKIAPPGPTAYNDLTGYRGQPPPFKELLQECPQLAKACMQLWDSKSIWYYDMELFHKTEESKEHDLFKRRGNLAPHMVVDVDRGTPFHRDTSVTPFWGNHIANLWISFEQIPATHSLHMVAGSMFGGPLGEARLSETVAGGGEKGRLVSFSTRPGDVVMLHPGTIHGGGVVSPDIRERNTLVLRVFGDDCTYKNRKASQNDKRYQGLQDGDHFSLAGKAVDLHPLVMGPGLEGLAKL